MDHVKFASDLGFLVARAKFAALNPDEEKKKGWWGNLPGSAKGLLLGLGGTGLAAGGMALGGHMLTGDYKAPFLAAGNALSGAADTFNNRARSLFGGGAQTPPPAGDTSPETAGG